MDKEKKDVAELIQNLEAEVNNGGFDQFFYNSSGDNTAETIEALEKIGAIRTTDIARRAAAKFPHGMPPKSRLDRQTILLQISPEANEFEELDEEFYGYSENLADLLKKYTPNSQ